MEALIAAELANIGRGSTSRLRGGTAQETIDREAKKRLANPTDSLKKIAASGWLNVGINDGKPPPLRERPPVPTAPRSYVPQRLGMHGTLPSRDHGPPAAPPTSGCIFGHPLASNGPAFDARSETQRKRAYKQPTQSQAFQRLGSHDVEAPRKHDKKNKKFRDGKELMLTPPELMPRPRVDNTQKSSPSIDYLPDPPRVKLPKRKGPPPPPIGGISGLGASRYAVQPPAIKTDQAVGERLSTRPQQALRTPPPSSQDAVTLPCIVPLQAGATATVGKGLSSSRYTTQPTQAAYPTDPATRRRPCQPAQNAQPAQPTAPTQAARPAQAAHPAQPIEAALSAPVRALMENFKSLNLDENASESPNLDSESDESEFEDGEIAEPELEDGEIDESKLDDIVWECVMDGNGSVYYFSGQ